MALSTKLGYNDYKFESSSGYDTNGGFLADKGGNVYNVAKKLKEEQAGAHYIHVLCPRAQCAERN